MRRSPLAGALLALLLLPLLPATGAAETLSVAVYRARLAAVQSRLRAGDWVGARTGAGQLLDDRIAFGEETIEPDRSVLAPLARASHAPEARAAAPALDRLLEALPREAPGGPASTISGTPEPDAKLLEAVRDREALAALPQGGRLPEIADGGVLAALGGFLRPIVEGIRDFFKRLFNWLLDLLPENESGEGFGLNLRTVTLLVALVAAVLAGIVLRSLRNRRRGPAPVEAGPEPLSPAADEDPLSREANEWERYARELAAAGRLREAIRAWYHAVLVAFYRAGALHYRKGRTNWEYVSAVPPGVPWRSRFTDLTRHFEREWYGRDRSTSEDLRDAEEMALFLLGAVRERAA